MGAYDTQPLRSTEFLFHELAHWIVLGHSVEKVPRGLSRKIQNLFEQIPEASSDSLEIDTALVTFLAGYMLDLWTDPGPIARSCRRNLKGPMALGEDSEVLNLFQSRLRSSSYLRIAKQLAIWFRPSAKSKLRSCAFVQFGV
jgi:hypothetical protein